MNKLITNQTVYYSLKQESITDFPSLELTTELNLKQTDWVRQQLINKVAVKASYMHKSLLTDDIIEEIMETHKIIGVEPHLKYLIVEIENTTNDRTFPIKVELSKPMPSETVEEPVLIAIYYGETGYSEQLYNVLDMFSKIEIDGEEVSVEDIDTANGLYPLPTGKHTIKYTLKDPTTIPDTAFTHSNIHTITIPNSVTTIGEEAFSYCGDLTTLTIEATTPPLIESDSIIDNSLLCNIYVPEESVEAYNADSNWGSYTIYTIPKQVDLGLPSGTKWATINVGANSPTEYGNYYMYGTTKKYNSADTPYPGTEDPLSIYQDTAAQVWGGEWHMPTRAQMQELIGNTTYEWIENYQGSGVNGGLFTAQNGNSVFLPAAGIWYNDSQYEVGNSGIYWSSSPDNSDYACLLSFDDNGKVVDSYDRNNGYSVRPVVG